MAVVAAEGLEAKVTKDVRGFARDRVRPSPEGQVDQHERDGDQVADKLCCCEDAHAWPLPRLDPTGRIQLAPRIDTPERATEFIAVRSGTLSRARSAPSAPNPPP